MEYTWLIVALALVTVLAILARNYCRGSRLPLRQRPRDLVLFVGPSGSGKTSLLYRLAQRKRVPTLSSQKEITASIQLGTQLVNVMDIPGHGPFTRKVLEMLPEAKGVVFLIDSAQRQVSELKYSGSVNEASHLLYQILNSDSLITNEIPIQVVCNKQQIILASKPSQVQKSLEAEIENLKKSQLALLEEDQKQGFLESQTEKFEFKRALSPVSFVGLSDEEGEQRVIDFILGLYGGAAGEQ